MTNLEKIEAEERKLQRIIDNNYCCEVCGKRFGGSQLQLAHIIAKHKNYIKRFGLEIIHHYLNMKLTCDKCNSFVMINPDSEPGKAHIGKIRRALND